MSALSRRYARALFEAARDQDAVDAIEAELVVIDQALDDPELRAFFARSDLPGRVVSTLFARLGEGRHRLVTNLFAALESRRRHAVLLDLRADFDGFVRAARGEVVGTVESARPLDDEQRSALEELAGRLSGQKVLLGFVDSPELIGGVRLRIGNTLYDGSVANALEELQQKLLEAPLA